MKVKAAHQTGPPIQAKGQKGHPQQIELLHQPILVRQPANAKPDQELPMKVEKKNVFHHPEVNHPTKAAPKVVTNQAAALVQAIKADLKDEKHLIRVVQLMVVQVVAKKEVLAKRKNLIRADLLKAIHNLKNVLPIARLKGKNLFHLSRKKQIHEHLPPVLIDLKEVDLKNNLTISPLKQIVLKHRTTVSVMI